MSQMSPTDRLLADAHVHTDVARRHRFFTQAIEGRLPPDVFRRYVGIEFAFVDTAARALGRTVHIAPSFVHRRDLATALSHLVFDQYDYFQDIADRLGLALPGPDDPITDGARPLHDHVLRLAAAGEYLPMLAGSFGAEWLYATWCGDAVSTIASRDAILQEWIELHADSSFLTHVEWLRGQLDAGLVSSGPDTYAECLAAFVGTVDAEVPFHDAAFGDVSRDT